MSSILSYDRRAFNKYVHSKIWKIFTDIEIEKDLPYLSATEEKPERTLKVAAEISNNIRHDFRRAQILAARLTRLTWF